MALCCQPCSVGYTHTHTHTHTHTLCDPQLLGRFLAKSIGRHASCMEAGSEGGRETGLLPSQPQPLLLQQQGGILPPDNVVAGAPVDQPGSERDGLRGVQSAADHHPQSPLCNVQRQSTRGIDTHYQGFAREASVGVIPRFPDSAPPVFWCFTLPIIC